MKLQDNYDVGIYCRLSRDDHNGTLESMSIANQRQVLVDYVTEKRWTLRDCYIDATDIIGLKQNPTNGRRFSPIFSFIGHLSE